jgi:hypothetical protein
MPGSRKNVALVLLRRIDIDVAIRGRYADKGTVEPSERIAQCDRRSPFAQRLDDDGGE